MIRTIKISSAIFLTYALLTVCAFASKKADMTLGEKMSELGDSAYWVQKEDCNSATNCSEIPYEYKTLWFWLDKSEKKRRLARNIENRNKYLLESGLFPTTSEVKASKIKKQHNAFSESLEGNLKGLSQAEKVLQSNSKKLEKLEKKKVALGKKREVLRDKTRDIFNSSEAATSDYEGLGENIVGLLNKSGSVISTKEEASAVANLKKSQKKLRGVIKDIKKASSDIDRITNDSEVKQETFTRLQKEIQENEEGLDRTIMEYGRAIANIDSEKEKEAAEFKLMSEKAKVDNAKAFSKEKIKEIEKQGNLARFVLQDLDSIKKDLKINELEAKFILADVNQKIQQSVLGQYIKKQNQKVLESAIAGACQNAKQCSEHSSINDSNGIKQFNPILNNMEKMHAIEVGK